MKVSIENRSATSWSGDILVLPFIDKKLLSHNLVSSIQKKLSGLPEKLLKKCDFKGKVGDVELIATHGKIKFDYILVVGLGESKELTMEHWRKASAIVAKTGEQRKVKTVISLLALAAPKNFSTQEIGQALSEGSHLALYRFEKFRGKKPEKASLQSIQFVASDTKASKALAAGLRLGTLTSQGAMLARDLVNTPPRDNTPEDLGRESKKIKGIRTRVFNHREIKKMGMGALYGVGMGSSNPPVFIEMHYKPKGRIKKTVALVGKGITFDSGGLSLKPPQFMETMKDDMAGSAAVIGTMSVLPLIKPDVEVYGYVTSAENMPDGAAQRPGDVVTAYNGKTIEVLNTDAEGRLALADALSYIGKHRKVDYVIDTATLTGAALVALGDKITAGITNDQKLLDLLQEAGNFTGESIWQLPLAEEEYGEALKSPIADVKNIGGKYAGTITAALFLKHFVKEKTKWAHLDIAGPSWANHAWPYSLVGGTGVMVRTFLRFLSQL